jgi:hypothetical protein
VLKVVYYSTEFDTGVERILRYGVQYRTELMQAACREQSHRRALPAVATLLDSWEAELDLSETVRANLNTDGVLHLAADAVVWIVLGHCYARGHFPLYDSRSTCRTSLVFLAWQAASVLNRRTVTFDLNFGGTCVHQPHSGDSVRCCSRLSHYRPIVGGERVRA